MGKHSELKKYQDLIVENGMAHIVYYAHDIHDIIHPFSVKDKELLSEGFLSFLEKHRGIIPAKLPVVLEIAGVSLTKEEKKLVGDTVWAHFCMTMTDADNAARTCIKRSVLYLLYTLLSAILIFAVANVSDIVISNLAYVPFWFFGYRLLIFLVIDSLPLWKNRNWYRQLASVKIIFSKDGATDLASLDADRISAEVSEYSNETPEEVRSYYTILEKARDKKLVEIGCNVASLGDMILIPELKGREFMSDPLAGYLGQVECFFDPDSDVQLLIHGKPFTAEEQDRIRYAVRNYYGFRIANQEIFSKDNKQQILLFGVSMIVSCILLAVLGDIVDVASNEFINMMFWFFGDYLLEFILISHFDIRRSRKILEHCRDMKLVFNKGKV